MTAAPPSPNSLVIRDRIRGLARLPAARVKPHPKNARRHDERQRTVLRALLADVGVVGALLVVPAEPEALQALRAADGEQGFARWLKSYKGYFLLADGHMRREEIAGPLTCLVLDLDAREMAEVLALLDPIGALARTDAALLDELTKDAGPLGDEVSKLLGELTAAGKKAAKKSAIAAALEAANDGPEVNPTDELRAKWGTALGQLWLIPSATSPGEGHRLLCGDSTKPEDVARLMGGKIARLMQTDAPYGIAYLKTKGNIPGFSIGGDGTGIENDELTDGPALQAFLERMITAALPHLDPRTAYYFWHPMLTQGTFFAAAAADILIHRQIIWVKPGFVLTRSGMYHWKHELCFYGWVRGHGPPWYGDKSQSSVWEFGRDGDSGMHPTQKPVELFIRPLVNHTLPGEIAYEPFAGSSSQLLACEQLGRLCYAMELEPKYMAVGLERASLRGLKPRLAP